MQVHAIKTRATYHGIGCYKNHDFKSKIEGVAHCNRSVYGKLVVYFKIEHQIKSYSLIALGVLYDGKLYIYNKCNKALKISHLLRQVVGNKLKISFPS